MKRLIYGLTLIAFGIFFIGLVIWNVIHPAKNYELTIKVASNELQKEVALLNLTPPNLQEISIITSEIPKPIVTGLAAWDGRQLVPLVWQNAVTESILFSDRTGADLSKVVGALRDHVTKDSIILAWWDLSRAIQLLAGREAPLNDPQARGLIIPPQWNHAFTQETVRWGAGAPAQSAEAFGHFIAALLADPRSGASMLRELAIGKPAYVVVHISDIRKISNTLPERVSIEYRDFPASGLSHGVIQSAKQWMNEENISGPFAAEPVDGGLRVHFTHRIEDSKRLIFQLLPFSTSNPTSVEGFELVFQYKGYWIYRLLVTS